MPPWAKLNRAGSRKLGVRWVRDCVDVDWSKHVEHPAPARIRAYHAAGLKTIAVFSPHSATHRNLDCGVSCGQTNSYAHVKAYFDRVQQQPGLAAAIDVWEIGNEPSLEKYWPRMLDEALPSVWQFADVICYYRMVGLASEGGWPGVVKAGRAYRPSEPFYSLYRRWTHAGVGAAGRVPGE